MGVWLKCLAFLENIDSLWRLVSMIGNTYVASMSKLCQECEIFVKGGGIVTPSPRFDKAS